MDIFSKRHKPNQRASSGSYRYDAMPSALKVQIIYAVGDVLTKIPGMHCQNEMLSGLESFFTTVMRDLCAEYGLLRLPHSSRSGSPSEHVWAFFHEEADVEKCLDVIEVVIAKLILLYRASSYVNRGLDSDIRQLAEVINGRFQEHAVGYELRDGRFIRIDSEFMHTEAVAPAMTLLHEPYLGGANVEFLKAHKHFRHGLYGECINECLKSFESTMKAICHKHGWVYAQTDTAKKLLATCEAAGLFPAFMQSSLSGLRSLLENVATVRNKLSGHGQGVQPVQITPEVTAFMLHSTGANILFLASLEKHLP